MLEIYVEILWKREEIAPEEQFLLLSTIFFYLVLDFYVNARIRFSLRDKQLFQITKVEITRVNYTSLMFVVGIFYLLNNGNPVDPDLMTKILERVYPDDKGVRNSIVFIRLLVRVFPSLE